MGTAQEKAVRTERFKHKQALLQQYTAVSGYIKKQIIHSVEPVLLYPIKGHLMGFGQVMSLETTNNILRAYRVINEIKIEENCVCMMGVYQKAKPLAQIIEK